jgi:hypothetical protein
MLLQRGAVVGRKPVNCGVHDLQRLQRRFITIDPGTLNAINGLTYMSKKNSFGSSKSDGFGDAPSFGESFTVGTLRRMSDCSCEVDQR